MKPKELLTAGFTLASIAYLSLGAFSPRARQEIMERDRWQCNNCHRSGSGGYHMQAAHYPELHGADGDENISNGRCLCTKCHIIEEIRRGNMWGARMLYKNQTIRHYGWIRDHGGRDQKPPFEAFIFEAGCVEA